MNDDELDKLLSGDANLPDSLSEKIRTQILAGTQPAKSMPRTLVLTARMAAAFVAVSVVFAAALGFKGWQALPALTSMQILLTLLAVAVWGASMLARSMRPGSGSLYAGISGIVALLAYEALVLKTFSDYSTDLFVHRGAICLALGVLAAALTALPLWLILRQGFVVERMRAGALMGLVSGLAGLTALTLHCRIITAPHAGIWHAAVVVFCIAAGALAGRYSNR